MSDPSSTSSSERTTSLGRTLAWCFAFLLLARFGFTSCPLDSVNRPWIPAAAAALRTYDRAPVETVALGSSLMRAAFAPWVWSEAEGAPPDSALNLALDSGVSFDGLQILGRAGGLPETTERVLVEVPYWSFNRNWRRPGGQAPNGPLQQVRQWGGLRERLSIDAAGPRARFVGDWLWPLYQRRGPAAWILRLQGPWKPEPVLPPAGPSWDPARHARMAHRARFQADRIARDHFYAPQVSRFELESLDALLAEIAKTRAEVILVRLPTRKAYRETALSLPGVRDFTETVDREIAARLGERVSFVDCSDPASCGPSPQEIIDYGHMSGPGAVEFTQRLFDRTHQPDPETSPAER
ncbi:MAG: hypothetical protein VX546_00060 [Myxococcota bacterium]|nr:hypothetical protein [Myxococcota bacterium]